MATSTLLQQYIKNTASTTTLTKTTTTATTVFTIQLTKIKLNEADSLVYISKMNVKGSGSGFAQGTRDVLATVPEGWRPLIAVDHETIDTNGTIVELGVSTDGEFGIYPRGDASSGFIRITGMMWRTGSAA